MRAVFSVLAVLLFAVGIFYLISFTPPVMVAERPPATSTQLATTSGAQASSTSQATSTIQTQDQPKPEAPAKNPVNKPKKEVPAATTSAPEVPSQKPPPVYTTNPESFENIDVEARSALVNILCMPAGGALRPISGSGVLIDPRGVILTNAHVAQYVLLSQSPEINLTCSVRTGSPAAFQWKATVMYMPSVWVDKHYTEINTSRPASTGEHDYALLLLTSDMQGNPVTLPLPYLPIETRENVTFTGNPVLVAGYPAELVGGLAAQQNLYAATSISSIKQLLTFSTGTVDVFSVGGVIEAQAGSSGGAVINPWKRLIALITTTSEGLTTSDRELHAISLNYINRDFVSQTTRSLQTVLTADVTRLTDEFSRETVPGLVSKYFQYLSH